MASLTQLRYAVAVADHLHFGRAAAACTISQPTLSTQLLKLEEEIGVVLFDRSRKPVRATESGATMLAQFRRVLQEMERVGELVHELQGVVAGTYRLGVIPTVAPHALPLLLPQFSKDYPDVELIVSERTTDEIVVGLVDESLDGGLLATPLHDERVVEFPVGREDFVVFHAAGVELPLDAQGRVVLTRVPTDRLLVMQEGHCLRVQTLDLCKLGEGAGFTLMAGSLSTLVNMVRAGEYFTVLPTMAARELIELGHGEFVKEIAGRVPFRELAFVARRRQSRRAIREALIGQAVRSFENVLKSAPGRRRQRDAIEPVRRPS